MGDTPAVARMRELISLSPSELTARGYRYLTVRHGQPGTLAVAAALRRLCDWSDRHPEAVACRRGTREATTWLLAPPHAEAHRGVLEALAAEHNPGGWLVRRAAQ